MRQLLIFIVTFFLCPAQHRLLAQEATGIRFAGFAERMPKPLSTLKETVAAYGDAERMNKALGTSEKEIRANLQLLYTPLLLHFKKHGASNRSSPVASTNEEKLILQSFQTSSVGISEKNQLDIVSLVMDYNRPLPSLGKLSWTKLNAAASLPVKSIFQQLKDLEGQFDWNQFAKKVKDYQPKFGESDDQKSNALQAAFDEKFSKLRTVKIQQEGFWVDIEEPDGAIALLEQHKMDSERAMEEFYQTRFRWWMAQYNKLSALSMRLDQLATQAESTALTGADRSLYGAMADLQARTWEAWQKLTTVTQGIFINAIVAATAGYQLQESIDLYKAYKKIAASQTSINL